MGYTKLQSFALVILRITIGWHFLYEGGVKILNPNWTAKSYLLDSGGFLKGFFELIAGNQILLSISDSANAWGLALIGLSLMLGIFTRYSSIAGIVLLLLYYLSHPAFPGIEYLFPSDGSYFIINKTLVELFALLVVFAFPTSHIFGLQRLIKSNKTFLA
ncbi:MAG: DoxX family membrane protein [Bacteroidales bacterium]|nr:DoxX family membrane protein [Bacteroidales bacterium]